MPACGAGTSDHAGGGAGPEDGMGWDGMRRDDHATGTVTKNSAGS